MRDAVQRVPLATNDAGARAATPMERQPVVMEARRIVSPGGPLLLSYVEIVFRNKWLLGGFLFVSLLVAWAAILVWPRSYESEARLLLRLGNENVGVDPTVVSRQTMVVEKSTNEEINSALSLLSSRGLAEQVVDVLGSETILEGTLPGTGAEEARPDGQTSAQPQSAVLDAIRSGKDRLYEILLKAGIKEPLSDHEMAVRELLDSVRISAPRESAIISVYCTAKSSELAQRIVETYVDQFLEQRLNVSSSSGACEFFEHQVAEQEDQLKQAMDGRAEFLKEHQLVSIEANLELLTHQLDVVEQDILATQSDLQQTKAEVADLKLRIDVTDDEIVAAKEAVFDETWSGMRQTVYELELRERDLASKYEDSYPPLQQVREQLAGARAILERMNEERVNRNTTFNPIKLKLLTDLESLQSRMAGLASRLEEKQQQKVNLQNRINELHNLNQQLAKMDRDILVMERTLAELKDKYQQARLTDELRQSGISSVSVAQPATLVERPVVPNKKLLAAMIVFLGVSAAVGLILLRESSSGIVRNPNQLATNGIDVLAELPYVGRLAKASQPTVTSKRYLKSLEPLLPSLEKVLPPLLLSVEPQRGDVPVVGMLGTHSGAGASTICVAIALAASRHSNLRVLVIDADLEECELTRRMVSEGVPGMWEAALGAMDLDQCVIESGLGFDFLPASQQLEGIEVDQAVRRPDRSELSAVIEACRSQYDLVIVDLPAADHGSSSLRIAPLVDKLVSVVEFEKTELQDALRTAGVGGQLTEQVLGCVLTKVRCYTPKLVRRVFFQPAGS